MTTPSLKPLLWSIAAAVLALSWAVPAAAAEPRDKDKEARPLRALLISGGCCHDYKEQDVIIPNGISARAKVEWTVFNEGGTSREHKITLFQKPGWADDYDVVVYNMCFGYVNDPEFVQKIVAVHRKGTPGVAIHCSMHTFRMMPSDEWREFLGITTRRHGPKQPLEVKNLAAEHPIMKGFPAVWTTGKEELYAVEKVWPNAVPLAQAYALDNKKDHPVIWTNTYGKTRVFGTTLAHQNETMRDPIYLDMLTRGLLWACDQLESDGKPKAGYGIPGR